MTDSAGTRRIEPAADAIAAVSSWLAAGGAVPSAVVPLVGDVSSRSYFRVALQGHRESYVVARYPPELVAAQARFRGAGEMLRRAGVRVPRLVRDDEAAGLALLEDLGPSTLYERAGDWRALARELEAALDAAQRIAALAPDGVAALGCEPLAAPLLEHELAQTTDWFLAPHGLARPELLAALGALCAALGAAPQVPCHRDFMARNLIADGTGGVGVLDFQDLRLGPAAYDVASLLNDSLFADRELERAVVDRRFGATEAAWRPYRRAVAQRALKAVGTFVKFAATGRTRHLPLVPPTLERAVAQLVRLPETRAAVEPLASRLLDAGAAVARGAGPAADAGRR